MSFSSVAVGLKLGAAINASDIKRTNKHVAGGAGVLPGVMEFCKRFRAALKRSFSV